jgi:hypothetical protein
VAPQYCVACAVELVGEDYGIHIWAAEGLQLMVAALVAVTAIYISQEHIRSWRLHIGILYREI